MWRKQTLSHAWKNRWHLPSPFPTSHVGPTPISLFLTFLLFFFNRRYHLLILKTNYFKSGLEHLTANQISRSFFSLQGYPSVKQKNELTKEVRPSLEWLGSGSERSLLTTATRQQEGDKKPESSRFTGIFGLEIGFGCIPGCSTHEIISEKGFPIVCI